VHDVPDVSQRKPTHTCSACGALWALEPRPNSQRPCLVLLSREAGACCALYGNDGTLERLH